MAFPRERPFKASWEMAPGDLLPTERIRGGIGGSRGPSSAPQTAAGGPEFAQADGSSLNAGRWRVQPLSASCSGTVRGQSSLSRWSTGPLKGPSEFRFECLDDSHALVLALKNTSGDFNLGSLSMQDATIYAGTLIACAPKREVYTCRFREGASFLRVRLSPTLISECYRELAHADPPADLVLLQSHVTGDRLLNALVQCLVAVESSGGTLDPPFTDSLSLALAGRLVGLHLDQANRAASPKVNGLPTWRLGRVIDYIEAHIQERITLADLARAAGLSRMHFAAAFRVATGVPPHLYVVQRRVEHSKPLLAAGRLSIAEVALAVGISSQSHYTSLFRRILGVTPHRWRQAAQRPE